MSIALKDATGATVNVATFTPDANGALPISAASLPLPTGAAKSSDIVAIIQALAPLATDADLQAVTAKMEAVRALLAAVLNVQGTVTANLGTLGGASTDASVQAVTAAIGTLKTALGTPAQAGGAVSVSNQIAGYALDASIQAVKTALGTPAQTVDITAATNKMEAVRALLAAALTINLPTGAAKDATVQAVVTALGTPLQAGGSVNVANQITGFALDASVQAVVTQLKALLTVDTVVKAVATDRGGLTQGGASAVNSFPAGGTGNAVGDVLTVIGGTLAPAVVGGAATGLPTQITVTAVSSGAVTAATISRVGAYTVAPTGTLATTSSGSGSGATVNLTFSPISFQVAPQNLNRRGTEFRNPSYGTGTIYFSALAVATADYHSFDLPVGGYKESSSQHVGTGAITMIGSAIGQPFYAREF